MNGKRIRYVQPLRSWYERGTLITYINNIGLCYINPREILEYMIKNKWFIIKKRTRRWITRDKKLLKKWKQIHLLGE